MTVYRLSGTDPQDMAPLWQDLDTIPIQGNHMEDVLLPNPSFTLPALKH